MSTPSPSVGSRLAGRYRLDELIGSGGMAQVWAATDTVLNRTVAVKILHPHLRDDEQMAARFRLEARHVARLDHHAVVTVYDTVTSDDVEAIVLEHVEGETLRDTLDQIGALSVAETVRLAVELCGALDAADRVGVVHRDIKPSNILLPGIDVDDGSIRGPGIGGQGSVKIADFGIAKTDEGDLTADDLRVGTASYVAPEQLLGLPVDGRTDQYSLGVVLYECLSGTLPFAGDTPDARAEARLHREPIPLDEVAPDVPGDVSAAIMTSLARDAGHRFASAGQLGAALKDATRAAPRPKPAVPTTGTIPVAANGDDPTPQPAPIPRGVAQPRPAASRQPRPQSGRAKKDDKAPFALGLMIAAMVLVVAALVLLLIAAQGNDDPQPQTAQNGEVPEPIPAADVAPLTISAITPFDPQGTGPPGENDELAELTIDGDSETFWRTERYQVPDFGLKDGVGLQVDLEGERALDQLEIDSPTQGWSAEVFVFDRSADVQAFDPDEALSVASVADAAGSAAIPLEGRTGSTLLLWVTDLGDGPERYRFDVSEVRVLGSS